MDEKVEQVGNAIVVRDKATGDILETIGANNFSYEFNEDTVQLVDSRKRGEVRTINLARLYDANDVALDDREKVVNEFSNFNTLI